MKHLSTSLKAIVVASLACAAGLAAASDSQTLEVSAKVTAICKFNATSTTLAFADIDPSSTTDATVSANVAYKCTKGTASAGVTPATGTLTRSLTSSSSETMPYTLTITGDTKTGLGFGSGKDLTLAVQGKILVADFQNASAGTYTENVTLNITP